MKYGVIINSSNNSTPGAAIFTSSISGSPPCINIGACVRLFIPAFYSESK